jgi:hypothetical protein
VAVFDCAVWRPIGVHQGGTLGSIGALLHQQDGSGSLFGWFSNPASEVSAHFWIGYRGEVEQYVDTSVVAWHAMHLNDTYVGVETEGYPGEPLTDAQVAGFGRVMAEGARRHGWPLVLADRDGQPGLGYHRMQGGVNTACPSDLRLSRRPDILAAAQGAPPAWPSPERLGQMGITRPGGGYWLTDEDGGVYAYDGAPFHGSLPSMSAIPIGRVIGGAPSPTGDGYWLVTDCARVYAFGDAAYLGPHPDWLARWGIGTDTNPVVGIVGRGDGTYVLAALGDGLNPDRYAMEADGRYAAEP